MMYLMYEVVQRPHMNKAVNHVEVQLAPSGHQQHEGSKVHRVRSEIDNPENRAAARKAALIATWTALTGTLLVGQPSSPTWESSYQQAQQRSAAQKKPVAVFVGAGANGWSQVMRDAPLSAQST